MAVTWALQSSSRQRDKSSPFFMSQHRISSFAATTACPAPVLVFSREDQTILDELDVTRPNDFECSYFLCRDQCEHSYLRIRSAERVKTYKYDLTMIAMQRTSTHMQWLKCAVVGRNYDWDSKSKIP